jgi:hypothetical protein
VETRRGARIAGEFWVSVEGVDDTPLLRQGDISLSGAYFPIHSEVGGAGSVQFLHLASADWEQSVQVLSRIIRVATIDDLLEGTCPVGIAVEFLPETKETRDRLAALVRHVAELRVERRADTKIRHAFPARVQRGPGSADAIVGEVSVGGIRIETNWEAQVGEKLRVSILRMDGDSEPEGLGMEAVVIGLESVSSTGPERYEIRLDVRSDSVQAAAPADDEVTPSCKTMMADLVSSTQEEPEPTPDRHLVGSLSRICLTSLTTLLSMEEAEGELRVTRGDAVGCVHFRGGQIIDAECTAVEGGSRKALIAILSWHEGSFEFVAGPVGREDVIATDTTALLLEAAVNADHVVR